MTATIWVAVLLLIGLAVMMLEVFVPSGGILGFVSVAAILTAVGTAFLQIGVVAGMTVLAITVLAVPTVLSLAFRWFPETPLGRRVLPPPPDPADVLPDATRRRQLREFVGRVGHAVDELLPWGTVEIGDLVVEAMSESGPITVGAAIEVVGVQGMSLVVRSVERDESAAQQPSQPPQPAPLDRVPGQPDGQAGDGGAGSPLSSVLETFEFEEFEPPRA
jgi:membrane-bound ClpP family serine protease